MMHAGHAEDLFTGMLDQAIADSATQSRSMGLADMLERQLTQARSTRPEVQGTVQTSAASRAYSQAAATAYSPAAATDEPAMAAPVAGQVSSTFGPRIHPIKGHAQNHSGLDLAAAEGTPIRAALEGKVVFARERGGYGNLVILEHPDGRQTYYGHCAELKVTEGQTVDQGQLIATVGATGLATGPHLHFEVRESSGQAIDPLPLVAQDLGLTATA
ncbi:MAG: peptidoglycan DD-metalloendopeptidase family protein [Deltaproteobacteria bacterium]|nr:peptidoglycan DD-metalloendopeptidase family protein [Deltaproteobacteria bacterium]